MSGRARVDIVIRPDDLSGEAARALVARHLRGMHENSPPESVFAFDVDKLRDPAVTFWTAWVGNDIAGMCALKQMREPAHGEIKSMRVADAFLGRGVGRVMLDHILAEARSRGLDRLWLETGSAPAFVPAIRLYENAGFMECDAFEGYQPNPFSRFMTKVLA